MKFLVVLIAIAIVLWMAGRGRRRVGRREAPPPPKPSEEMVACSQCGLHLPRGEALPGRGGLFCCEAHRAAFERRAS